MDIHVSLAEELVIQINERYCVTCSNRNLVFVKVQFLATFYCYVETQKDAKFKTPRIYYSMHSLG